MIQQAAFLKPGKGKGGWGSSWAAGKGGWACGGWGKGKNTWASPDTSRNTCAIHGKKRSVSCLTDDGAGGFVCLAESQCQVGANDTSAADAEKAVCSVHGKTRSMACLTEDGAGGHCCLPDKACKQTGETPSWAAGGWGATKSGPDLPRTRVSETLVGGTVMEWKGKFGWIQADVPVEHPMAKKNSGRLYVAAQDLQDATEMVAGGTVQFYIYSDSSGLGAEEVYYTAP